MTTPTLPTPERIDELTAALEAEIATGRVDGFEMGDFERDPFTTMTHGELRAILAAAKRLIEAEKLLHEHSAPLCARFIDRSLRVPMPSPVVGCACLNCRTAAFLSPAPATEHTKLAFDTHLDNRDRRFYPGETT